MEVGLLGTADPCGMTDRKASAEADPCGMTKRSAG
jgi:hypothetical protein